MAIHLPNDQELAVLAQRASEEQQLKFQVRLMRINIAGNILAKMIDVTSSKEDIEKRADKATLATDILMQKHGMVKMVETREEGK